MKLASLIWKDPTPFSSKRDFNWKFLKITFGLVSLLILSVILAMPSKETLEFEGKEELAKREMSLENTERPLPDLAMDTRSYSGASGSTKSSRSHNSSMIVARGGVDLVNSVPPGRRFRIRLRESVIVSQSSMPVIGIVLEDVSSDDTLAVPKGSLVFGEATFNQDTRRGQVVWRFLRSVDGRERALNAISIGLDGKEGIEGKVHSNEVSNTVGQTLSRFVGSYAEGSMQRGPLNGNPGGSQNGFKNAVADTAKDRADKFAESLRKERVWIEISNSMEFLAVLSEPFLFRDPGGRN